MKAMADGGADADWREIFSLCFLTWLDVRHFRRVVIGEAHVKLGRLEAVSVDHSAERDKGKNTEEVLVGWEDQDIGGWTTR